MVQEFTDIKAYGNMSMNVSSPRLYNKGNIFLGVIEYELNGLLGASHLVECSSISELISLYLEKQVLAF